MLLEIDALNLSLREGGRALLQRPDCVRVPADSARELLDIDTPDSLRQAAE